MSGKLNILVLAGGDSEEREVSLASARAITEAIIRLDHEVKVIDSPSGRPLLGKDKKFILQTDDSSLSKIALKGNDTKALAESLPLDNYKDSDLVFIALHGGAVTGRGRPGQQVPVREAGVLLRGSGLERGEAGVQPHCDIAGHLGQNPEG